MKINGKEIKGIKKLCTETRYLHKGENDYVEIFVDDNTAEVWGVWHDNTNEWTEYNDTAARKLANVHEPKTMKELQEIIEYAM